MKKITKYVFLVFILFFINGRLYSQENQKPDEYETIGEEPSVLNYSLELGILSKFKKLGRKTLFIKNHTGMDIKVYVAYRTRYSDGTWKWENIDYSSSWSIKNGKETYLLHGKNVNGNKWRINADYIYIWAESIDGKHIWNKYKDNRLTIGEGNQNNAVTENFNYIFK